MISNMTVFEKFVKVTGINIESFFEEFNSFSTNFYSSILNYYNGKDIDKEAFEFFDYLKEESDKVEEAIDQNGHAFDSLEFWNLVDIFSGIQASLDKIDVLYKWLRSSRTNRYSQNIKLDYIQKQNQSLENISSNFGYSEQDSWLDLAVQNNVEEEDYTNKGGKMLKAILPNRNFFDFENVVDSLEGDNIYGKDIKKRFELSGGDMSTISGRDNLRQIFEIIMSTIAGSIPEFPNFGIPSYIYGTNINVIQYPSLFRSIIGMFQNDKRFVSFEVLNIKREDDSVHIQTKTSTIMGDEYDKNITI